MELNRWFIKGLCLFIFYDIRSIVIHKSNIQIRQRFQNSIFVVSWSNFISSSVAILIQTWLWKTSEKFLDIMNSCFARTKTAGEVDFTSLKPSPDNAYTETWLTSRPRVVWIASNCFLLFSSPAFVWTSLWIELCEDLTDMSSTIQVLSFSVNIKNSFLVFLQKLESERNFWFQRFYNSTFHKKAE